MEPIEVPTEDTAGNIAEEVTSIETPVTEQADEAQVVQTESAEAVAAATDETTETIENIVEEAVVESTPVILADTDMETTETDAIVTTTTEQPVESCDKDSCIANESWFWPLVFVIILVIVAAVVIKLLKKKTGKPTANKPNGKTSGSDVVEIYVGNLSYDMNDNQLRKEFERFGVVKSARVITHRTNNKSKGYGFVEMPHRKEALIAIKALENAEVLGRRIRVNEARANTRPPER